MTTERARGRPKHQPTRKTRQQVGRLVAFGNTLDQAAEIIGITKPTLIKHYRRELNLGALEANNKVMENLFRQATKDDVRAFQHIKFWLNCRAGWSEYAPIVVKPLTEEKKPKLGKKEQQLEDAANPDESTTLGELMARRLHDGSTIQ